MKNLNLKIIIASLVLILIPTMVIAGVYSIVDSEGTYSKHTGTAKPKPCHTMGYTFKSCPGNKTGKDACPTDNTIFRSCQCDPSVYRYDEKNCTNNKSLSGKSCEGKYDTCECDTTKYKYTKNNCINQKVLSGEVCGDSYEKCVCPEKYSKKCTYPMVGDSDECDKKFTSCRCSSELRICPGDKGAPDALKCKEETGILKFSKCLDTTKSCESYNYYSSVPVKYRCKEILLGSKKCYTDCVLVSQ